MWNKISFLRLALFIFAHPMKGMMYFTKTINANVLLQSQSSSLMPAESEKVWKKTCPGMDVKNYVPNVPCEATMAWKCFFKCPGIEDTPPPAP